MLPHRRHGETRPIDLVRLVAIARPGLAQPIQQNAPTASNAASSRGERSRKRVQSCLQGVRRREREKGVRVERARKEMLVIVLRRHGQKPVRS